MDASLLLTVENLLQQKNKKNLLQTSSATIKPPSLSLSARSSPVSNKRHKFNISTASLASYSSQTNNNYANIMDSLDIESLEDLLRKVCMRFNNCDWNSTLNRVKLSAVNVCVSAMNFEYELNEWHLVHGMLNKSDTMSHTVTAVP